MIIIYEEVRDESGTRLGGKVREGGIRIECLRNVLEVDFLARF